MYRTVLFYKLQLFKEAPANTSQNASTPKVESLDSNEVREIFAHINTLSTKFTDNQNRFVQISKSPDKYMFMLIDGVFKEENKQNVLNYPIKGRLIFARKDDIAQWVYEDGTVKFPDLPPDVLGQGEITHFVLFEDGVVGVEYNPHGPRISKLCEYLFEIWNRYFTSQMKLADVNHVAIPNENVLDDLIQNGIGFKWVALGVDLTPSLKKQIRENGGPLSGLIGATKLDDESMGRIVVTIKAEKGESMVSSGIYNFLKQVWKKLKSGDLSNMVQLKVKTELGQEIDLLNPVVKSRVNVEVAPLSDNVGRKVVSTSDMYNKIIELYGTLVKNSNKEQNSNKQNTQQN